MYSAALRYDSVFFADPDAIDERRRRYVFSDEREIEASICLRRGHRNFPREDDTVHLTMTKTGEVVVRRVYRVYDFRKITAMIEFYDP